MHWTPSKLNLIAYLHPKDNFYTLGFFVVDAGQRFQGHKDP